MMLKHTISILHPSSLRGTKQSLLMIYLFFFLCISFRSQAQTTDAQGRKQGYWKKYDPKKGTLLYEGLFKDDKPQGVFKYYNINDSVKAKMNFVKDGKFAYATLYHLNGKKMAQGKYIGETKDSTWIYFDENGNLLSQETFVAGKKHGKTYVYFPDGVISEEHTFKNGIQEGPFKQFFAKNLVRGEGNYVNGEMDGKNAYYYPNGVTAAVGYYKNGYKKGPWIYKESNGKIKEKELYKEKGELASAKETEEFFNKNKPVPDKADASALKTEEKNNASTKPKNQVKGKATDGKNKSVKGK